MLLLGCGSYGFAIDSKWHNSCCDEHDKCYSTCLKTRTECDTAFQTCMQSKCKAVGGKKEKEECSSQASMFHSATSMLGCDAFQSSQEEACSCSLAEKAKKYAQKIVEGVQEGVETVAGKIDQALGDESVNQKDL
jgi:hypothetical protein